MGKQGRGPQLGTGRSLPTALSGQRFPLLLLEEEGRPSDLPLRENFIERVCAIAQTAIHLAEP